MAAPGFAWMPMAAFTDRRLGARDLRVLGVLYGHAGSNRMCWPAVATIAELTGIDRRDVQRAVRRLEGFGWVSVEAGGGRSSTSRYRLWSAPQASGTQKAGDSPPKRRVMCHEKAGDPTARTYQNSPENRNNPSCASPMASATGNASSGWVDDNKATMPLVDRTERKRSEAAQMEGFAMFWAAYPRRRGKADAFKVWSALKPDVAMIERILEALVQTRASSDWRREGGQFIPYPATWLRRQGWEDELEVDIDPLPTDHTARYGEGQRIDGTLAALDSLFRGGQDHAEHDVSEGHGISISRLWH